MRKGEKMTIEQKRKIGAANSIALKGKKLAKGTIEKMRAKMLKNNPMSSAESRRRVSENRKGKCMGENHPRWKGGIWRDNRKEYKRFKGLERVARQNNAPGEHTIGEWETRKAQYNWTCPCCGRREPDIKLTEDHIVPLIKGGSNNIENIQPLCGKCNSAKGTKVLYFI